MKAIKNIKVNGYHIFKSIFTKKEIHDFYKALPKKKANLQANFFKTGTLHSSAKAILNLQSKNPIFLKLLTKDIFNKINSYFLNDKFYKGLSKNLPNYTLSQFAARSSGKDKLVIHIDDKAPSSSDNVNYLQWAIPMIDVNEKNGCTSLVPKSHKSGLLKPKLRKNLKQKNVIMNVGDVAVWDGRIWHQSLPNKSNEDRWVIIITFCKWFFKPHYDIARNFPKKYYSKLNKKLKIILGFASIPKLNEKSGLVQRGDLKSANKFIKNKFF
tara:strand:- start:138 stop:944 length:807 start_codon:yes stop_codon:yes gene_type:complete